MFLFGGVDAFLRALEPKLPNSTQEEGPHDSRMPSTPNSYGALMNSPRSAREVATLLNLSVGTIVSRRRAAGISFVERRKSITRDLMKRVAASLRTGKNVREVASEFKMSVPTVYRIRRESPGLLRKIETSKLAAERSHRRACWLEILRAQGGESLRSMRAHDAGCYSWLYRNDRAWLLETNARLPSRRVVQSARVDWSKEDVRLASKLEMIHRGIASKANRPRISKAALLRMTGRGTTVQRNLYRLPKTALLIQQYSESIGNYQRRRISNVVKSLKKAGTAQALWKIARIAGVKKFTSDLREYARSLLEASGHSD
jgi:hypothetical protein